MTYLNLGMALAISLTAGAAFAGGKAGGGIGEVVILPIEIYPTDRQNHLYAGCWHAEGEHTDGRQGYGPRRGARCAVASGPDRWCADTGVWRLCADVSAKSRPVIR